MIDIVSGEDFLGPGKATTYNTYFACRMEGSLNIAKIVKNENLVAGHRRASKQNYVCFIGF